MKRFAKPKRSLFVLLLIFASVVFWNNWVHVSKDDLSDSEVDLFASQLANSSDNEICKFPQLKLKDSEINKFFINEPPLQCSSKQANWVYANDSKIFFNQAAVANLGPIACDYFNILRRSDDRWNIEKQISNFPSGTALLSDFFLVKCKSKSISHINVQASIVPSTAAIERSMIAQQNETKPNGLNLNVYMLVLDSVSRMMFMRKLPKTFDYITKVKKAIVLEGYNIVGDGTPQALIPILTVIVARGAAHRNATGTIMATLRLTPQECRYCCPNCIGLQPFDMTTLLHQ